MNRSNDIKVSVIVLTYNQEHIIGRTIESILAQKTDFIFEIIIGEDASPSDNTRAVCEAYTQKYSNIIRLMPKAPNKGLLKNYMDCVKECRGKYIASCAGDDWWHNPDKLQMQVEFLEANTDYGVVYTDFDMYNEITGNIIKYYNRVRHITPPSGDIYKDLLKGNTIAAGTVMFRKSDFDQCVDIDMFFNQGFMMEDYPMWLSMAVKTKFKYIDESTFSYSLNQGSASNNGMNIKKAEIFEANVMMIKTFFINKYPVEGYTINTFKEAYNLSLLGSCVVCNLPQYAKKYAWEVLKLKPNIKNFVKMIVCFTPYLFKKYSSHISKKS